MSTVFHPDYPNCRYIVDAGFTDDNLVNVYHGNNKKEAERIANFWDEKVNTYMYDLFNEAYGTYGTIHPPQYTGDLTRDTNQANHYVQELINRHTNKVLNSYI